MLHVNIESNDIQFSICEATHKVDNAEVTWLTVICHPISTPQYQKGKDVDKVFWIAESKVKAVATYVNSRLLFKVYVSHLYR